MASLEEFGSASGMVQATSNPLADRPTLNTRRSELGMNVITTNRDAAGNDDNDPQRQGSHAR